MDIDLLQTVGQVAGIGGLGIGVLLLVFRQIIAKSIFPTLKKDHAYGLLRLISILVFTVAIAGIGALVWIETSGDRQTADGAPETHIETHGPGSPIVTGTGGDVTVTIDGGSPVTADDGEAP